jgi:acetyl-CoA synthetase
MTDRRVLDALRPWEAVANELDWVEPWSTLYEPTGRYGRWFGGGRFNLAANCVDRHAVTRPDQPAIRWEGELGDQRTLTYGELLTEVTALTGSLRSLGVAAGDRVALHMGWLPETVVGMLACARVGAVCSVVPTSLPSEALAERLDDFGPAVLFTQDGAWRHGAILPLKARADEALSAVKGVEATVVVRRTGVDVAWYEGDRWLHDLVARKRSGGPAPDTDPVPLDAEHPVLATHLANRRGRPVSVLHGTATLAAAALAIHRHGVAEEGVFWCAADVAWMAAQAHGVIGPLLAGATSVMFEGMLDVPTRHRAWDIVQRYGVSTLVTTPTVVRRLRGWSRRPPEPAAVATLRRVVMAGEPVDPVLTEWLTHDVGGGDITVVDAWGQIQLGGIVSVDQPVDAEALPNPGFAIVDDDGDELPDGQAGQLVLRLPWAGMARDMEGTGAQDVAERHWHRANAYATNDRASRRPDGSLEFLGRVDEVVSISGQIVSLGEVRQVLLEHPFVEAAEVIERADPRLGRSLAAIVALAPDVPADETVATGLLDAIRELLGGLARPRALAFIDRLGDELSPAVLRRTLGLLTAGVEDEPQELTWEQVLTASSAVDSSPGTPP